MSILPLNHRAKVSNKLVLDNIKSSISNISFNDFAEKNNTRLDAFEEVLHGIKDDLESLKEKGNSANNAILTNPVPIQINDTAPPTHTDNPGASTIPSEIAGSINEHVERASNIKNAIMNTTMNLYKFIVDRDVTCGSTHVQSITGYLRLTLVFMWDSALLKKFNFCFSMFFC